MQIILTHEQADFDAIASLLGGHIINNVAIPVLPRKINRNVRAFLSLYGVELPFSDFRDIPSEIVDHITLVDAQSMVSVKGANLQTKVHVIDHHPLRDDIPSNWEITIANTGANTTIFVETIRNREIRLSAIQATLLLLGIYEDTGSLTYTRTNSRDLLAAGYLLEEGANLSIASDFLNHPLSQDQQKVYDQLCKNIQYLDQFGHRVVIARADARDMDEELSTVAHKLQDLLDPDGLFVLVQTRSGVQMIARSTSDDIDVAKITFHFGGGGHERAAASLIRDKKLEDVHHDLLQMIPEYIKPAITVAQIMSRKPHLLSPNTSVLEAAKSMQRYGYEGFPVVDKGKVIGLLTRRAVDRAITHKLNLNAKSLMEAGEFHIHPDDSIESLQHVMIETGWGQIPVVDNENAEILGIVTRTDLLKTLTEKSSIPSRRNLADQLEKSLPLERLVMLKTMAEIAHENKCALYIVGGFVRDLLLSQPSSDFDLVVEGDAILLARMLTQRYGGRVTSHTRFGTAKWLLNPEVKERLINELVPYNQQGTNTKPILEAVKFPDSVDLVTARTEFYTHPTALPTIERSSIKLDLHRRDFTINTLALRLEGAHYGELYDYWGGLSDLRHGIVKVLHSLSFVDDPTRILRAIRFEKRFNFKIEKRTLDLIKEAANLLERVSGDRIRHELDSIFIETETIRMLDRLADLDLLKAIHPDLIWDEWLKAKFLEYHQSIPNPKWEIDSDPSNKIDLAYIFLLLRQPQASTESILTRLKLSSSQIKMIHAARSLFPKLPFRADQSPSEIVAWLDKLPIKSIFSIYIATDNSSDQTILMQYVSKWRKIEPIINGHQLRALGIPPGPQYRYILDTLKKAWLDGKITSPEEEQLRLERLIRDSDNKTKRK